MLTYSVTPPESVAEPAFALVLHGLGDSMAGWQPIAAELRLPALGFVFANAPMPYFGGYSWYRIPGMTGPADTREQQLADLASSRAKLVELVDHLLGELDLPPERLFLLGFSQGCAMALDHALRSDHRYAGVVGISGHVDCLDDYPEQLGSAAEAQAILWTHGSHDPVIPLALPEAGLEHLRACGLAPDWRVYPKGHELHVPDELRDLRAFLAERLPQGSAA